MLGFRYRSLFVMHRPGYYFVGGSSSPSSTDKCTQCDADTYKTEYSKRTDCTPCSLSNSRTLGAGSASADACVCALGFYLSANGNKCSSCPTGADCSNSSAGVTIETMKIERGYWRTGPDSAEVLVCPVFQACLCDHCRRGHEGKTISIV